MKCRWIRVLRDLLSAEKRTRMTSLACLDWLN